MLTDATIVIIAIGLLLVGLFHFMRDFVIISFRFSLHLVEAIDVAVITIAASSSKKVVAKICCCFAQVLAGCYDVEGLS